MKIGLICASLLFAGALAMSAFAQNNGDNRPAPPGAEANTNRVEIRLFIDAPPEKVWRALTNPRLVKQWFLGADTETDWRVGSPLVQRGVWRGRPTNEKGRVLESERGKRLVHTHWSAASGLPDRPENYRVIRYDLAAVGEGTELTFAEENIPNEAARQRAEETWQRLLAGLKAISERRRSSD